MQKTIAFIGLSALVLGCLLATAPGNADGKDDPAGAASPFKGEIIAIASKAVDEEGFGAVLIKAKVQKLGEQSFLVGTTADTGRPDNWAKGKVVWVPIDDVLSITEFANLKEYKEAADGQTRPDN